MDANQEEPCVICLEHIKDKAVIKGCSHSFCLMCIRNWAETNTTCPLCKHPFDVIVLPSAEEEPIAPASKPVTAHRIEEELQCLDHSFFLGEVQRLLHDAERLHLKLQQESRSQRGFARWERDRFEALEQLVSELRTHKRRLQSLLQFDPHSTLHELYRIQDKLQDVWISDGRYPPAASGREEAAPVRYGADDADNISDDEDYAEDMAYLSISKTNRKMITPKKKGPAPFAFAPPAPAAATTTPVATPSKKNKRKVRAKQLIPV